MILSAQTALQQSKIYSSQIEMSPASFVSPDVNIQTRNIFITLKGRKAEHLQDEVCRKVGTKIADTYIVLKSRRVEEFAFIIHHILTMVSQKLEILPHLTLHIPPPKVCIFPDMIEPDWRVLSILEVRG